VRQAGARPGLGLVVRGSLCRNQASNGFLKRRATGGFNWAEYVAPTADWSSHSRSNCTIKQAVLE